MVKKTYVHNVDPETGKPYIVEVPSMTHHQRKSLEHEIPWTAGPKNRWEKFKRKAWG